MYNNYTVSDFYKTFESGLTLVAGAGGMSRTISEAGFLDYEIDPTLKDKYYHTNFQKNQLTVTTFLVAKDNPHLILDAIKYLVAKGTSGLVIKNVFKLPIHESVLRYADSMNFPIFYVTSQNIYVELLIFEVYKRLHILNSFRDSERCVAAILSGNLNSDEIIKHAKELNPSITDRYYSIYVKTDEYNAPDSIDVLYNQFISSELNIPQNCFVPYNSGAFIICDRDSRLLPEGCISILTRNKEVFNFGISNSHSTLRDFDVCLRESLYAASLYKSYGNTVSYGSLGSLQLILPFADTVEMQKFKSRVLTSILDYDIENNSNLLQTLSAYVDSNCNIDQTAKCLSQHKNTIRYRLDKITSLSGLDYKSFSDLEQLSLAIKIYNYSNSNSPENDYDLL